MKSRSFTATSCCTAQLYLVHQFKLDETSEHYFCTSTSTYSEPDNCSSASTDALRLYCRAFPRLEPLVHPSPPHLSIRASQSVFFFILCIFCHIFMHPTQLSHLFIPFHSFRIVSSDWNHCIGAPRGQRNTAQRSAHQYLHLI